MTTELSTVRLKLEPLAVAHAEEMAGVLGDPALYDFTGGAPPTLAQLRERYARQVVGHSADGAQTWLNWVAHIHPAHVGSTSLARALGLRPTDRVVHGEVRWERRA